MVTSMLIDAAHPEETRVVVVKGNRLEEFDVETSTKAQLKGNIYLAKVMRVEPSLQSAFVDYGGNRHGFLAFSEIHPDYYQIPVADRQALIDAEVAAAEEEAAREDEAAKLEDDQSADASTDDAENSEPAPEELGGESADDVNGDNDATSEADDETDSGENGDGESSNKAAKSSNIDAVGGDALEEVRPRREPMMRNYKIQEVIKRRQIILIQVVKEERGTKGAALTTYLSLAGRYCVLMPNTARGGGISRKIANMKDRRRLKTIVSDLEVEDGMALIVRTAGAERSKAEIRRDFDYLFKLWQEISDKTLNSRAPALIHEEANLIRRSIRDIYNKDIDEVLVEGEEGYKTAKAFMRMLMPSHAKRVQPYRDKVPLLHKYKIDAQLDAMMNPEFDAVVRYCDGHGIRVLSDEIYHGITYGEAAETALRYSANAIVMNGFSKFFCMTGWRLGWMVVPEELSAAVERLAQNLYISAPNISQRAAIAAFECDDELNANVAVYAENRCILLEELPKAGLKDLAPADGAFYIYANVSHLTNDSSDFCRKLLKETGIAITPGIDFDAERGNASVRISFAGKTDETKETASRLKTWLA